jgi:hypothetical protein
MLLKSLGVAMIFYIALMLVSSAYSMTRYAALNQPTTPPTITTLRFDPEQIIVQEGETFTINVRLTDLGEEELWGFEIGVKFDKNIVEYVGVELPSWRFVFGETESLFWVAGLTPQIGDQTLLALTFTSKGVGETTLSFYSHKLATVQYWDAPHDYVGWPITHEVATSVVKNP